MTKAKEPTRVTLGRVYEDIISGFVGTATERTEMKNGCVSVTLMPRVDETGKPRSAQAFYETQLIDQETSAPIESSASPKVLKMLGKRYRDKFTGFEGIAEARGEMLNGGIRIHLLGPLKPDGTMGESWMIDEGNLIEADSGDLVASAAPRGPMNELSTLR